MAYFSFADRLISGKKIQIFNNGEMMRDFTYIDDITEGMIRVLKAAPEKKEGTDRAPHMVYNIGGGKPVRLMEFVRILAEELEKNGVLPAGFDLSEHIEFTGMQKGDVRVTYADTVPLMRDFGFMPQTSVEEGLGRFAAWYRKYRSQGEPG